MPPSPDELAGAADLFGGLTRAELRRGFEDLAARGGWELDDDAFDAAVADAIDAYYLVAVAHDGDRVLVPGPAALPTLPTGGEDLPHLLDVPTRDVDRDAVEVVVEERLRAEAAVAVDAADADAARHLLDVCFDAQAWADLDIADVRSALAPVAD